MLEIMAIHMVKHFFNHELKVEVIKKVKVIKLLHIFLQIYSKKEICHVLLTYKLSP